MSNEKGEISFVGPARISVFLDFAVRYLVKFNVNGGRLSGRVAES